MPGPRIHFPIPGSRFGRLTVIEEVESRTTKSCTERCIRVACDCGKQKVVQYKNLRAGRTTSCGCFQSEGVRERLTTLWRLVREQQAQGASR